MSARQSSTWGDGVYRSTDGGTTWRHMGLRETQTIGRVVIDPRNPNIVFVTTVGHLFGPSEERGLYRTKDGGATWQQVLRVDANTGATDVIISPSCHRGEIVATSCIARVTVEESSQLNTFGTRIDSPAPTAHVAFCARTGVLGGTT